MAQVMVRRSELADLVRGILLRHWDPIGIDGLPERFRLAAQDEYDLYIGPIVQMIDEGRDKAAFERHLIDIETTRMSGRPHFDRAAAAAQALFDLEARCFAK
jgi:hypothetical protein